MCDYDYSFEEIDRRTVTTRKRHRCDSCMEAYPVGTVMVVSVGKFEGEIGRTYACPACTFALAQPDHSDLHLCWGWAWDYDGVREDAWRYDYLRDALARGAEPTVFGVNAEINARELALAGDG